MNTLGSFRRFLAPPVFPDDDEKTRVAGLLNIILWGVVAAALVLTGAILALLGLRADSGVYLVSAGIMVALGLGGQLLMRRGQARLASIILEAGLVGMVTSVLCTYDGIRSPASAGYVFIIIAAGLLLGGRGAVAFAALSLASLAGVFFSSNAGLIHPTPSATDAGDLVVFVLIFGLSAVLLYLAANSINTAIDTARRNTRAQVKANWALEANRLALEARTRDLGLAAEIGQRLGTRRDLDELLSEAVELIRGRFDLYYAQAYLTEPGGKALALRAGTGPVGVELLRRQHRLPVGFGSINGMAAYEARPILVADTANSPVFRPNPLLPHTRSELAVPLIAGEKVVGVLDLQSTQANALTDENLPAFEAVAGQLAVAVENTRLFDEAATARAELEAHAQQLARSNWDTFLNAIDRPVRLGYTYDPGGLAPLTSGLPAPDAGTLTATLTVTGEAVGQIQLEPGADRTFTDDDGELTAAVARQAALQIENLRLLAEADRYRAEAELATRRLTREGWQAQLETQAGGAAGFVYDQTQVRPLTAEAAATAPAALTQHLTVHGETIGALEFVGPAGLDDAATHLVTAVADRLSSHLENLRLAAQTETALAETDILYRASQALGQARNVPDTLQGAADVANFMGMTGISLVVLAPQEAAAEGPHESPSMDVFSLQAADGKWNTRPPQINASQEAGSVLAASVLAAIRAAPDRALICRDSGDDAEAMPPDIRAHLRREGNLGLAGVGLRSREELLGCLTFTSTKALTGLPERYFQSLLRSLADQVAIAINSQRLYEQTQKRAAELEAVARVSTVASTLLDAPKLLQTVVDLTKYAFFLYHTHIYLLDNAQGRLTLAAGAGDVGQQMVAQGWSIPIDRERSLVARAARERRGVIANDVRAAPDFLPNPLLPETRSEMAVPIVLGDRLLGVFDVQADRVGRFTTADLQIQTTLAAQVAVALQNAYSFTQTQAALAETEDLYRASAQLNTATTYDDILSIIRQFTVAGHKAQAVFINVFDRPWTETAPARTITTLARWSTLPEETLAQWPRQVAVADFPAAESLLQAQQPVVVEAFPADAQPDPHSPAGYFAPLAARSAVFAPLRAGGQWLGYINALFSQPRAFSEAELHRLTALAGQAAVAINNRQLFETIQASARRERLLREIATRVRTSMDADTILRTAVRELGTALNRETFVRLGGAANAGPAENPDQAALGNSGNAGNGAAETGADNRTAGAGNGTAGVGPIVPALRDA
jgi:GAF domain-containing protein